MITTYKIVDAENNPIDRRLLRAWVTIPATMIGVKFKPGSTPEFDVLEITIRYDHDARFIYTNKDRDPFNRKKP